MTYTKDALKEAIQQKLRLNYGCTEKQATDGEIMKACALALRDIMAVRSVDTQERTQEQQEKRVHYMSLEFLMGRRHRHGQQRASGKHRHRHGNENAHGAPAGAGGKGQHPAHQKQGQGEQGRQGLPAVK